ncbi:pilus assembly protein PilZ [Candidatus Pelagibacter sp.]|nr:pilus assembly protein PilZ [Candidatus Pelagibacter sp.]
MMNKNEKGFALVLSLILLLVMSLMGGALIVISSGDHQSNNTSDQYQQAFYVAETGLLEGEKKIINQFLGPWTQKNDISGPGVGATVDETDAHNLYLNSLTVDEGGDVRHTNDRSLPRNQINTINTNCFKSFRNIKRADFQVTHHVVNQNFGKLIEPIFGTPGEVDKLATDDVKVMEKLTKEKEYLKRFRYEFFSVNIGSAPYLGTGSSIKKTSNNSQSLGTAYKIYACGIMVAQGTELDDYDGEEEIIIPLETVMVMPN